MLDQLNTEANQYESVPPVEQAVEAQEESTQAPVESSKEYNIRIMRERAEAAERRAAEYERILQQQMLQQSQSGNRSLSDDEEDDDALSDTDFIDKKYFKKAIKKAVTKATQITQERFEKNLKEIQQRNAEQALRRDYSDIDSVVTEENLYKLSVQKPHLYRSLIANQDTYDRGAAAYEMITNSGIINNAYSNQARRIQENKSKPKSAAVVGPQESESPLAQFYGNDRRILSKEDKERNMERVQLYKSMK